MNWLLVFQVITATVASFGLGSKKDYLKIQNADIYCGKVPMKCNETEYRSYDGSCNNLEHSWWGTPNNPYLRLLNNTYSDGISKFPKSISNEDLPNPRTCSLGLYVDIPKPDILWNLAFMQYGQLLAHDLSLTAGVAQTKKGAVVCCSDGQLTNEAETDPRCAPILIPKDDPYNAPEGIECMDFYRTETTKDGRECQNTTKTADPLTAVTSFLDVSFIYGSNVETAMNMREGKGGKLKHVMRKGKQLLTQDPDPLMTCNVKDATEPCYYAGDVRVNQNPQLALFHNLYLVLHNSIADKLAKVNPNWDDETLYQETRRIMIAIHQHITYYEFLPPILGKENMIKNNLIYPNAKGPINDYDPTVHPGVSNEFGIGYRIFHTEIIGNILSYNEKRTANDTIHLSDWMDRPSICEHNNHFNGLTIGLATQPQSAVDRFITNDVLNYLFKYSVNGFIGQDLIAIDIQRGRDHGCATYAQTLKHFGLSDPKSFFDLIKYINPLYVARLKTIYKSHMDIDLRVGLSLEYLSSFALGGKTLQAIMTEQLKRTRKGDYYFYENGNGKCHFNSEQLAEIRKSTIASVLCSNPEIKEMQSRAFELVSLFNPLKQCRDIHSFNAAAWKDLDCGSD